MGPNPLFDTFTEDELNVADILLNLEEIILKPESKSKGINFSWGCKRKRFVLDDDDGPRRIQIKPEENGCTAATNAASPNNPLTISFTESDETTNKHSVKRIFRKRSRDEYIEKIKQLSQNSNRLREELEKVKVYHNELKATNSKLKATKKQVLNFFLRNEEYEMERISPRQNNIGYDGTSQCLSSGRTAQLPSSSNGPEPKKNVARVPDLNLPAEEAASGFEGCWHDP